MKVSAPADRSLLARAYDLLARRAYSRRELRDKLAAHADSPEALEETLAFLEGKRYLDDGRLAEEAVRSLGRSRGWGRDKVRAWLYERGIPPGVISQALDSLDTSDEQARAVVLAEKLRQRGKSPQQVFRFLRSRGFSSEHCRGASLELGDPTWE